MLTLRKRLHDFMTDGTMLDAKEVPNKVVKAGKDYQHYLTDIENKYQISKKDLLELDFLLGSYLSVEIDFSYRKGFKEGVRTMKYLLWFLR